jgi:hypothetical protein
VCLCSALPPRPLPVPRLRIIILVHPQEAKASLHKRTVPILQQVIGEPVIGGLPKGTHIVVLGVRWGAAESSLTASAAFLGNGPC